MMVNIQNYLIDYSLFSKYEKEYFLENKILVYFEDEICLKVAVCDNSKLSTINNKFNKLIKYVQLDELDLMFMLNNIDVKIKLYKLANDTLNNDLVNNSMIQSFLYELLNYAINLRTSDIHIEQFEDLVLFRFRIDGRLKTFFVMNKELLKPLSSYIKLKSNLDITQVRLPQDSRFSYFINTVEYNFRVSTMPTLISESIVIRILDKKNVDKSLQSLGLSKTLFSKLQKNLLYNQGLILITGPTGSGKTTTLYSILKELKSDEKKIITVEDPVEYKMDSIVQIAVNTKIGLSFDLILKNILRQDPDIILIGEIRDKYSLDIALQASLTGHLVIASIHANNAIETISRLVDLKADPFLISSCLKLIMAQRLVLSFCKKCKGVGCSFCNYTKFYDRVCIAELLEVDENISSMIFKKSDLNDIKKYLHNINFKTLLDDGKQKVEDNITSWEEIYKEVNY